MMDLETLDVAANAVIVSVGAVFFDPHSDRMGERFHRVCGDLDDQQKRGRTISTDTVKWWLKQDRIAQQESFFDNANMRPTFQVLSDFSSFLGPATSDEVRVWGNGAAFDNEKLRGLYGAYGFPCPWKFYNDRCYRTVKSLTAGLPEIERIGTHHNALDDAVSQARHLQAIFRTMRTPVANDATIERAA